MIGDTLFDCGESLDHYLANYEFAAEVHARVRKLREEIRAVQQWIDAGQFECVGNVRVKDAAAACISQWLASGPEYPPRHSPGRN
jgi:hypothetical protein